MKVLSLIFFAWIIIICANCENTASEKTICIERVEKGRTGCILAGTIGIRTYFNRPVTPGTQDSQNIFSYCQIEYIQKIKRCGRKSAYLPSKKGGRRQEGP